MLLHTFRSITYKTSSHERLNLKLSACLLKCPLLTQVLFSPNHKLKNGVQYEVATEYQYWWRNCHSWTLLWHLQIEQIWKCHSPQVSSKRTRADLDEGHLEGIAQTVLPLPSYPVYEYNSTESTKGDNPRRYWVDSHLSPIVAYLHSWLHNLGYDNTHLEDINYTNSIDWTWLPLREMTEECNQKVEGSPETIVTLTRVSYFGHGFAQSDQLRSGRVL